MCDLDWFPKASHSAMYITATKIHFVSQTTYHDQWQIQKFQKGISVGSRSQMWESRGTTPATDDV